VTGWTALIIAVLFLGGVQLIALGIIGEYVGRVYGEAKLRPLYLVADRLGFETIGRQTPAAGPELDRRSARRDARDAHDVRARDTITYAADAALVAAPAVAARMEDDRR
jgi:dolichol-phosphate mannosyltransferase